MTKLLLSPDNPNGWKLEDIIDEIQNDIVRGGPSTGPRTPEGLERCRKANWRHGRRSAEAVAERKAGAAIRREIRRLAAEVTSG